jgi:hypothetical protein
MYAPRFTSRPLESTNDDTIWTIGNKEILFFISDRTPRTLPLLCYSASVYIAHKLHRAEFFRNPTSMEPKVHDCLQEPTIAPVLRQMICVTFRKILLVYAEELLAPAQGPSWMTPIVGYPRLCIKWQLLLTSGDKHSLMILILINWLLGGLEECHDSRNWKLIDQANGFDKNYRYYYYYYYYY